MEERYSLEKEISNILTPDEYIVWYMFSNYEKYLPENFKAKYTKVIELEKLESIPLEKLL
ncbi:MAG TPA: hypothetical protein VJH65_01040 [Candidatus Nanoarchaeia archaeon]|nr:hypothetical protein [Candidatus Nanoarchaeia archaeon]